MAFLKNGRLRMQSTASMVVRGLDPYFSPYEALWPLIDLETNMPRSIWEPAAGGGVVVRALLQHGFKVIASDIADYGVRDVPIQAGVNYLEAICPAGVKGIVTNPPYKIAGEFVQKAVKEVPYSAWLLRTNFMESQERFQFFCENPPSRILVSSRRLPMMHRLGYNGPKSTSNVCFSWFIWDEDTPNEYRGKVKWFDWRDHLIDLISEY